MVAVLTITIAVTVTKVAIGFDDATVATLDVRDAAATDVRGALVLAGGPAKASVVVEAAAPSVGALPPRVPPETHQLRPFAGYGAGLW